MRILIATVQVPFLRGGAEILAEGLRDALRSAGHQAEIIAIPFKWFPAERIPDHMLACRLFDLTETKQGPVDRVIGLKFPAYLVQHPNKVLWLLHQHRTAYEFWDHPFADLINSPHGVRIRDAILEADQRFIPKSRAVYTISGNVSQRLRGYCGIESTPLYHPPQHADRFFCAGDEDYFYFPSRLSPPKRQDLVLQALARTRRLVRVHFAGAPDTPAYADELRSLARKLKVQRRVEWLGPVTDDDKRRQYAHSRAVLFPPEDEDYGYVTLEAMLAAKPVLTCCDSGGPLEFVRDAETGRVVEPTPQALADAMDTLWEQRDTARAWGEAGRIRYHKLAIAWPKVIERLLA
ncbi:MAG TPA: glycosyltransferase family 4 protein [Gemmataceae bacterium]